MRDTNMRIPLIVTHPSTLMHGGLRSVFTKSQFGPLFIAPELSEELERQIGSSENCIWLLGVGRYDSATNDLLRRVKTAAPGMKPVILAAYHKPGDISAALKAGACGFLCQDMSAEQLLRSLELTAGGQAVVHRDWHLVQATSAPTQAKGEAAEHGVCPTNDIESYRLPLIPADPTAQTSENDVIRGLSRRELLILRMLTEGASNKGIALKLVITESTVKVHMKAILRKLRLQNRTQVAMWARDNVHRDVWVGLSNPANYAGSRPFAVASH